MAENSEAVTTRLVEIEHRIRMVGIHMRQAAQHVEPGVMLELTEELDGLVTALLDGWLKSEKRKVELIAELQAALQHEA